MTKKSGSFDIAAGTTLSGTTETLNDGNTGAVETGATLTSATGNPEVTFGNGTTKLTNSGTISSTGDRALDASGLANGSKITVTNNAGGKILDLLAATGGSGENNDAFKIKTDFSGGSVTVNNSGYLVAGNVDSNGNVVLASSASSSGRGIDFGDIVSSPVTINNNATGVIGAADSDAIRPGDDFTINNYGTIIGEHLGSSTSGNDGIDYKTTTNLTTGTGTINNFAGASIIGAHHGITGDFAITVNNSGTITGQLGSGINLDTVSGTTDVTNHGTISGTAGGTQDGDGIDVDYLIDLENYGKVEAYGTSTGSLSEAVTIGGGTINNYAGGVIESVQRAITVDNSNDGDAFGATTIYNEGSIIGDDGQAISITDTFTDVITNKGTITGSVSVGDGNDVFNAYTGSTLTGQLDGGAGIDTLILLGTGTGSFGDVVNFETLDVQGGTWTLSDDEAFSLGATIESGTNLQIGTGGSTGTLTGAIDDEGTLTFDRSGSLTMSSGISGAGTVVQNGPGTTVLSAQNSYSGGTTLDSGTLDVDALHGAGSGAITFETGTQTLRIETAALQGGDFSNVIKGFASGDRIDLANSNATHADLGADNVLTISGGTTGTVTIHLDPSESFAGEFFHLASDGGSGLYITENSQPCYCRGTLVLTDRGERRVEELQIGDKLVTLAGAQRPIKWIGRRGYAGRYILGRQDILPICIKVGALGDGIPRRDLWISPHHAMFIDGVLIEARDLVNDVSIVQSTGIDEVEYFHLELETHDVILAEGAASETFIDDDSRMMFHNAHEYARLYPNEQQNPAQYCAPRRNEGYEVETARRHINARAGLLRPDAVNSAPKVRGFVDRTGPGQVVGWVQLPDRPDAPLCVDILAAGRLIGCALANVYRRDLLDAGIGHGRYGFEFALSDEIDPATVEVRCTIADTTLRLTREAIADARIAAAA
jgi:autotransporter-associated beta strand protein